MSDALLIEITATKPDGTPALLCFADRAVRPFPPSDGNRPNQPYESRVMEAPSLRRMIFEDLEKMRPGVGTASLTLSNADGGLDQYEGYAWNEVLVLLWDEDTAWSAATTVLYGVCGPVGFPRPSDQPGKVVVPLYDFAAEASKALQTTVYAGTNGVGGVLYEGLADGIKGRPKPLAYGDLTTAQIPAPQVNAGVQGYQLHDGPIEGHEAIFDRGDNAGVADSGDFSGAAFDAAAPSAAHYVTDIGRGLIKGNFSPVGQATFGCKGEKVGGIYVETAGPILARLLARAGVPGGRIGTSVAALSAAAVMGFYAGDTITLGDALAFVAAGAPAAVLPGRDGVWQAVPWGPPAVLADFSLGEFDVLSVASDDTAPLPAGEIRVGWGRIWQTFAGNDLAPALVGTSSQERLAAEYRWAVVSNATVKARLPATWRTVQIETALRSESDAQALAAALMTLLGLRADGKPRRMWRVTVELRQALAQTLGQTVAFDYPPKGINDNFLLVGEEPMRPRARRAVWTLWG